MCELLGMSARFPADLATSLDLFRQRGGEIGPHADGWGLAFFEEQAARVFKEPVAASKSRCLEFLQMYGLESNMVQAHIRKANPPNISSTYANTHPFEREAGGRAWVFAHNGMVPGVHKFSLGRHAPMGDTDSEWAFCLLMEAIHECISHNGRIGDIDQTLACLEPAVSRINPLDEFNFLLGNGEHLFVHVHTEMHLLKRICHVQGCHQHVILVATKPLSDEPWQCIVPNKLLVLKDGDIIRTMVTSGPASSDAWQRRLEQDRMEARYLANGSA